MVKKISMLALAGMIAMPTMAFAGAADMQSQIDALTRQLEALKAQMEEVQEVNESIEERAEKWDLSSRIQFSGDFRARGDYYSADTKAYFPAIYKNAAGNYVANNTMQQAAASERENDSVFTNRFRLNMRAKALENVEFKGRLAMYKTWGQQNLPYSTSGVGPGGFKIDGAASRQPEDSILRVDRAFVNWNNIGGQPIWFSVGRRPTTDGPPSHLRLGNDSRMATPTAVMDWPFDGVSMGYAYNNLFGQEDMPGRVRFCWGRGFEDGVTSDTTNNIDDMDFAGVSWDVYKKGDRFFYLQSFAAFNVVNYPDSEDGNLEMFMGAVGTLNNVGDPTGMTAQELYEAGVAGRTNVGNMYHTSGVYMDKWENLNFFVMGAWSQTDPDGTGNGFLGSTTDQKDGYLAHLGVRYDMDDLGLKLGLEYNYGSEYWVSMTPGHDDLYASKLATRGNVWEVYGIYDIPGGEAISKFGKAFIRLGYQHYEYDYTGSGDWNAMPVDIDQLLADGTNSATYQLSAPVDSADQVYLTFEAYF